MTHERLDRSQARGVKRARPSGAQVDALLALVGAYEELIDLLLEHKAIRDIPEADEGIALVGWTEALVKTTLWPADLFEFGPYEVRQERFREALRQALGPIQRDRQEHLTKWAQKAAVSAEAEREES